MGTLQQPDTFASHLTVCSECGNEVQQLRMGADGKAIIYPCGHSGPISVVPNPKLSSLA